MLLTALFLALSHPGSTVIAGASLLYEFALQSLLTRYLTIRRRVSTHPFYYRYINIEEPITTPLTASNFLFLFDLCFRKSQFKTTIELRQRRHTRLNSFQLLFQLHPDPILELGSCFTLGKARRWRDLAVRHVLAVGFRSYAGAVHERARTNFGSAG